MGQSSMGVQWDHTGISSSDTTDLQLVFGAGYKFNRTVAVEQAIGGSSPRASKYGWPIGGLG